MQALTELLPATAVTHAVKLPFLDSQALNLVVAKSNLLQIYETTTVAPSKLQNGTSPPQDTYSHVETKLILVAEYPLAGTFTSLARIKVISSKSGGDALLISFKDAKISLVEWDPETYSLSTISIHYYESDDLQGSCWAPVLQHCSSYLTADPSSRCAALKFGVRHLAVLPFRQLGDDLTMGDYDPDLDEAPQPPKPSAMTNGAPEASQTPYASSFVLPLTALDPNLLHPIELGFLYEYREPTLGVLSASKSPSVSLSHLRKDVLTYTAFTLDLEQRARTLLLSVSGLPSDLFKLAPLPLPVGGALLLGGNEIIHVDQSGKTNAVAVNEFARQVSAFPMTDQSDLGLRLEGCIAEQLNPSNGDMLIILNTGELVVLSFRVDGRSVSGLALRPVPVSRGGLIKSSSASCAVALSPDVMFIGSETADSLLVRCNRQKPQLSRKRSHGEMLGIEEGEPDEDIDEDEDDLYADETPSLRPRESSVSNGTAEDVSFQIDDRLPNLTTNGDPCFVNSSATTPQVEDGAAHQTGCKIILSTGRDGSGGLSFLSKTVELIPSGKLSIPKAFKIWSLATHQVERSKTARSKSLNDSSAEPYDRFIISTSDSEEGDSSSRIHEWLPSGLEEKPGGDFDSDSTTLNASVLGNGKRIVQVTGSEIRCLQQDLSLAQIMPMDDEDTDTELIITQTSFADPYLLVLRNDSSVMLLKVDDKDDQLEIMECGDMLNSTKWSTGCLYKPHQPRSDHLAFLLSVDGAFYIFNLSNPTRPVFVSEGVNLMPPIMAPYKATRRAPNRETIVELLVADLGDSTSRSPYLVFRTAGNGLALYQPYHYPPQSSNDPFAENLRWLKILDTSLLKSQEDDDSASQSRVIGSLECISDLGGYSTVLVQGIDSSLILKEATGLPGMFRIGDRRVQKLSAIHIADCKHGLLGTNSDSDSSLLQLPKDTRFDCGWSVRRAHTGAQVDGLCYDESKDLCILGINQPAAFTLPDDDDWHQEWAKEDLASKPTGNIAKIQLFDSKTWNVISEVTLERDEIITSAKFLNLEMSEITNERKPVVVVSTAIIKGEDLPANGSIYVFDIVNVVPNPERPETNRALKQITREEVKGAVSALSEIGTEGLLLAAQGQKCMVRGLKEDNSLLPVAFLDAQTHVTVLRNVKGTGLALIGDAIKGVWLFGYSGEPHRMRLFGKTRSNMEVVTAEFLPWGKQLYIMVADSDCNIHVLEFNPEDPKSLSGQRLLNRSIFHAGQFATSMVLISNPGANKILYESKAEDVDGDESSSSTQAQGILMTTQSGALNLITPLSEDVYRRLGALQAHLTGVLDHACGLNPRAYRAVESEGFGSRGILDGQILKRWHLLNTQRKSEACARVGSDVWEINTDLGILDGFGRS